RDFHVTGVQTCALPILCQKPLRRSGRIAASSPTGTPQGAAGPTTPGDRPRPTAPPRDECPPPRPTGPAGEYGPADRARRVPPAQIGRASRRERAGDVVW